MRLSDHCIPRARLAGLACRRSRSSRSHSVRIERTAAAAPCWHPHRNVHRRQTMPPCTTAQHPAHLPLCEGTGSDRSMLSCRRVGWQRLTTLPLCKNSSWCVSTVCLSQTPSSRPSVRGYRRPRRPRCWMGTLAHRRGFPAWVARAPSTGQTCERACPSPAAARAGG